MATLPVQFTVELKLAVDEFPEDHPERAHGARGVLAGKWKAYPHGWSPPPEVASERVADALTLDMEDEVLASCKQFIEQQYRTGDAPLAWRIKDRAGKVVAEGDDLAAL